MAEAMFSEDGEDEDSRLDTHVDAVDRFVGAASTGLRVGLGVALAVISIAPVLLIFRMRRLHRLSVADRVSVLSRLERSHRAPFSLAFVGWRTVITLIFYENESELKNLGYTG